MKTGKYRVSSIEMSTSRQEMALVLPRPSGLTIIEAIVVLGAISIIMGLLLPAIQRIRESCRATKCQNNLREIVLAAQAFEIAHQYVPGPWFNAEPGTDEYRADEGFFVRLLPYMDRSTEHATICFAKTTFDISNNAVLATPFSSLNCPSAAPSTLLHNVASLFSGPAVDGLTAATCDYIGNGGYFKRSKYQSENANGPIRVHVSGLTSQETLSRTTDGLSNTLLVWESIGSSRVDSNGQLASIDELAIGAFELQLCGSTPIFFQSSGQASSKSYLYSWAGLRIGNIIVDGSRFANGGNLRGRPCSYHPGICYSVTMGGSVFRLTDSISADVVCALASRSGREPVVAE